MKKLFFVLLLFVLLISSGCNQTQQQTIKTANNQEPKLFESFLPQNTISPNAKIKVNKAKFTQYDYTKTGYTYTYTYQDLGLKITTSPGYDPYFYELQKEPIIIRNGNILYNKNSIIDAPDYIKIISKNPNISFENEIIQNQLSIGCQIITGNTNENFKPIQSFNGFQQIDITSMDGNLDGDNNCKQDKEFPNNGLGISFFMDPKHPDKYYKISMGDGCAPGPCTIFGKIEFF